MNINKTTNKEFCDVSVVINSIFSPILIFSSFYTFQLLDSLEMIKIQLLEFFWSNTTC